MSEPQRLALAEIDEARVLAPVLEQAIGSGRRASEQLEALAAASGLRAAVEAAHG